MGAVAGYLDMVNGVAVDILENMTNIAGYRGPDDEGYAFIAQTGFSFWGGQATFASLQGGLSRLSTYDHWGSACVGRFTGMWAIAMFTKFMLVEIWMRVFKVVA